LTGAAPLLTFSGQALANLEDPAVTEQATVTVGVIAKEIGVSDAKVKKAIETLKIEPVGKRGACKLYAADVVEAVRKTLA
jgi:hypothetical protein